MIYYTCGLHPHLEALLFDNDALSLVQTSHSISIVNHAWSSLICHVRSAVSIVLL